jgi:tripartite ATP-independent transporter DctP family solute receptor
MRNVLKVLLSLGVVATLAAPAIAQEKIVLRMGHALADDHPESQSFFEFSRRVKEKTNGRVDVQVFNNAQLGNERDMLEGCQIGSVDMTKVISSVLTGFIPQTKVFDMPYLFRDRAHFHKFATGPVAARFNDELLPKAGFKGLAMLDAGIRGVYNTKRPINRPEDLKGLKIRVPESPVIIQTFNALGANATPLPVGEIYNALQQGVIDAAENAPVFVNSQKHYEIAKFFSETNHFIIPDFWVMSMKSWQKLPPDIQKIIAETAVEIQQYEFKLWLASEDKAVATLKANGMKFNSVDIAPFQAAVETVYKRYEKDIDQAILKQIRDTK